MVKERRRDRKTKKSIDMRESRLRFVSSSTKHLNRDLEASSLKVSHSVKKFEQTYFDQFYKSNSIEYNRRHKLKLVRQKVQDAIS